jgi:hypothetical protein
MGEAKEICVSITKTTKSEEPKLVYLGFAGAVDAIYICERAPLRFSHARCACRCI